MAARPGQARLTPFAWAALGVAALIMVAPLLWTLLLSLKHNADLVGHSGAALHPPYTLENYGAIFGNKQTTRWLLNSTFFQVGKTAGLFSLEIVGGKGCGRFMFQFRRTLLVRFCLALGLPSGPGILR